MSILYLLLAVVAVTLTGWPIRAWREAHDNGVDSLFQAAITGAIVHGGIAVALAATGTDADKGLWNFNNTGYLGGSKFIATVTKSF